MSAQRPAPRLAPSPPPPRSPHPTPVWGGRAGFPRRLLHRAVSPPRRHVPVTRVLYGTTLPPRPRRRMRTAQ